MRIKLQGFSGEMPRVEPYYLADQVPVSNRNAAMRGGSLSPFRQNSLTVHTFPANRQSIYLHGAEWIGWDHVVNVVPGPVADDRLYITHDNAAPTLRYNGAEYPLALNAPTQRPVLTIVGTVDQDIADYVAYAYTWVTQLGEESAPSPLSARILWSEGTDVQVDNMDGTPPAGRLVTHKRIYRAVTSTTGATDLFFVKEVPATDTVFVHDIEADPIAEAIPTADFGPVPSNLRGITAMPNGIMAGFRGKELWFCEPYQPHAWPSSYVLTTNDPIVGLSAFGTTLAVLTTGTPYVVQGLHPDSMAMEKVEQPFPCMSARGVVDMGYSAVFPSTDGLVSLSAQGGALLTRNIWTREQWQEMRPTTMRAARFGSLYGFSYIPASGGGRRMCFIDPAASEPSVMRVNDNGTAFYTHVESGFTYMLADNQREIVAFDDATRPKRSYVWRSKPFRLPYEQSMGALKIETDGADGETVTASIYADGQLFHSTSTTNRDARLPAGLARTWQVELSGTATVLSFAMARTIKELNQ
ncbi:hypothetical protein PAF17_16045 [Paracoccus sp. Z330]|uniref:Phage tail protein n=1 Tax=Paracoccus onchidii TaxID=3017813 RepID=A0ABT4ZI20_9RHOB|nr:hypothetical protein [Paracoccus onchidii]MDB6179004.1 hypothetical protein [Paracoccus onchidii]